MPPLPRPASRICVALGCSTAEELGRVAEAEYKDGNTFLEFRLDHLKNPASGVDLIGSFRQRYPEAQILATCRHCHYQGHFKGLLSQQLLILRSAAEAGALAVDLEIEAAEQSAVEAGELRELSSLVVSFHDFSGTPALNAVRRRLQKIPADAYKLVTTIRKPGDTMRLVQFIREHSHALPLIALGMSEAGAATRILAPNLGCLFTYAAPSDVAGTAPGQISSKLMRGLYRCDKLTPQTRLYGIIADPVSHTKSPLIHNKAFHSRRLDAVYLPFLVAPSCLGEWMKLAVALPTSSGYSGIWMRSIRWPSGSVR